jgi:hypothetical protein
MIEHWQSHFHIILKKLEENKIKLYARAFEFKNVCVIKLYACVFEFKNVCV